MSARRITIAVSLLLLVVALASATGSGGDGAAVPGATEDPAAPAAPAVDAGLPAERPVRAGVGDVVRLQVTAQAPDEARIDALGLRWPVGPGLRGDVAFLAERTGRFRVVLRDGRRVGAVVVER